MEQDDDLVARIRCALTDVLVDAKIDGWAGFMRGKVRDSYDLADGRRLIVATDRQSAFDQVLAAVPFKGMVLNSVARFWFEKTADLAANHVLDWPDPNVLVARRLTMLPVEMVVRDYLTGDTATSIWTMYAQGARSAYGYRLPDGMTKHARLPETILTPTTKGLAGAHDKPLTPLEVVAHGLLTDAQWEELSATARALFARGKSIAAANGLILVDTKYEFGTDDEGRIVLADEIHTPDSSRYWRSESYESRLAAGADPESLDKDFLRRWIVARCDPYRQPVPPIPPETLVEFSRRYIALFETVTGQKFLPPSEDRPVRDRVVDALRQFEADATAIS